MYKLKDGQESFTIVDGPDAGKTFKRGVVYQERPAGYARQFTKVRTAAKTTTGETTTETATTEEKSK